MFAPTAASRCLTVGTPEVNRVGLALIERFFEREAIARIQLPERPLYASLVRKQTFRNVV